MRPWQKHQSSSRFASRSTKEIMQLTINQSGMLRAIDGFRLVARIKALQPAVRVIVMTADATSESAVEAERRGAHDYLAKPFEMPELLYAVHRALEQQKSPARTASSEAT